MINARTKIRPILRHCRTYTTVDHTKIFQETIRSKSISQAYSYVIRNHLHIDQKSLISFTYNLLQTNVQAAISLQHVLAQNEKYQIPNEIWSTIIEKVCSESNYIGAMFIYHEIIDNYRFYEEISLGVQDNDQIPFLVDCERLIQLGTIFFENNDPQRLDGLIRYFRRFYSFWMNQKTYQKLLILTIETFSKLNDFQNSLKSFVNLAYASQGPTRYFPKPLKIQNKKFNKFVTENIESNQYKNNLIESSQFPLDIHQFLLSKICETDLYDPIIERNIYSSKNRSSDPIIKRSVLLKDLPNFSNLILQYIKNEKLYDLNELLNWTKLNHYSLNIFIINALCQLNYHELAFNYLKTLSNIGKNVVRNQSFLIILNSLPNNDSGEKLKQEIIKFYTQLRNGHIGSKIGEYL
ncbi:uncharacterized protein KGF55_004340 [Candida pseudojiufengensis]|uniref:uncharacterized protein n=1 Tax=Candida pseudojiufengensis TaxID=497109 RepID=UPI00222490D7|nr:uncharacterized protein KGF55_004340 [Candida pseudojiufengensis]KAI5960770.1 hypothetical protein KGF55_004340 [Candida pseudojiufengensis]